MTSWAVNATDSSSIFDSLNQNGMNRHSQISVTLGAGVAPRELMLSMLNLVGMNFRRISLKRKRDLDCSINKKLKFNIRAGLAAKRIVSDDLVRSKVALEVEGVDSH